MTQRFDSDRYHVKVREYDTATLSPTSTTVSLLALAFSSADIVILQSAEAVRAEWRGDELLRERLHKDVP